MSAGSPRLSSRFRRFPASPGSHEFDENGDVPGVVIETVIEGAGFKDVGPVALN